MTRTTSHYNCACGVHVHDYVLGMAIINIVFASVGVVLFVMAGLAPFALLPLIQLGMGILVVWGNRFSVPCFYLPSLFLQILQAMIFIGFAAGVVSYGCYLTFLEFNSTLEHEEKTYAIGMGLLVILLGLILVCVALLNAYLVEAFYRGYLYLKERNARAKIPPVTVYDP
ncbi:hypothetical protein M3Y94_00602900 [Aphelenchoides besseyi]|nr:hypothetical protein M3Y94_00602900 [Aphelenchoides besseyi]